MPNKGQVLAETKRLLNNDLQNLTYKWTRFGNLESSGGICPLIELLFMWLPKIQDR